MKPKILLLIAALLVGLAFVTGRSILKSPAQQETPKDWRTHDLGPFSFQAPADFSGGQDQGIDSAVWSFRNENIRLELDYGVYSNDLQIYGDKPEYHESWVVIHGKKAKLCTFRLSDSSATPATEKKPFIAAVYFPDTGSPSQKLTLWASTDSPAAQEKAKLILNSVRFK